MPTKPLSHADGGIDSQAKNRWPMTVYDQHKSARFPRGRPWWGYCEYPSDKKLDAAFVCELMPGDTNDPFDSSWNAPWYPDQVSSKLTNYFRLDMKRQSLTWLYAAIIADDKAATQRYWEAAAKIAYTNGWKVPEVNEPVSFQIQAILLEPPRSHKIAEAAMAGDPWILGQATQVNEELSQLLKGIRVVNDLRQPVVTPEQVLAGGDDIDARIAKAVAAALEMERENTRRKRADTMAARKRRVGTTSAAPGGVAA